LLLAYYEYKYGKTFKPVKRRSEKAAVPESAICPRCGAPHQYIYKNNGSKGQYQCKVCGELFNKTNIYNRPLALRCPYCGHILVAKKDRKHFRVHKCVNSKCSYYRSNLANLPKDLNAADKHKYKLNYIYMVANYAMTAAAVIKPFTDTFDYKPSKILSADETYIKVKGVKHYVWLVMDACKKSILGYQVSNTRAVGPCILAMRMAFAKFKEFPNKALKFIADGYSAYPIASQQFKLKNNWDFDVTQVIGLTNDDAVSTEFRWVKQVVERLNRTFKSSYRVTDGYGSENSALYGVSLWVAYYNFLRPHPYNYWKPLNELDILSEAGNMPAKWQLLIYLGQEAILKMQESKVQ